MILLAFDSYKGSMSAEEACEAAASGIREVMPDAEIVQVPLSDGGEGLVDCVSKRLAVKCLNVNVHDPLMNIIQASYVMTEDNSTAFIEMAASSGLTLVPPNLRNPMLTTTYGVGDLIIDALRRGCKEIIMGIGGSATCDGGKGMIQCLQDNGYLQVNEPLTSDNNELLTSDNKASSSHESSSLKQCKFTVACDVTNPLFGPDGAAYIFAPQKGATPSQVKELDAMLRQFAKDTEARGLATPEMADFPGAGAAGGLGYALMAYLNAELKSGIDIILQLTDFESLVQRADLIITGEGKSDEQTLMGKVPHGVLKVCKKHGKPVWLLSGCIEDPHSDLSTNFDKVVSINESDSRPLPVLMLREIAMENMSSTIAKIMTGDRPLS